MRAPECGTKITEQRVHGDQQAPRPAWDGRQRDAVVAVAKEHVDEALPGQAEDDPMYRDQSGTDQIG
jgi:hypothetical protein